MVNWTDILVLCIIVGFAIMGLLNGFLLSVFRLVSYFISIFLAIKLYPIVAKVLMTTALYTNIQHSIFKSLMKQQETQAPLAAGKAVESLNLPSFLNGTVFNGLKTNGIKIDPAKILPLSDIMDKISKVLAQIVIDVISLVVLYLLIRIGLIFVKFILKGISKLPVFKQVDKVGGFALGAVEGLLSIYILFAIITLFRTSPQLKVFFDAVDKSLIANFFYQHNFIIQWMFSK